LRRLATTICDHSPQRNRMTPLARSPPLHHHVTRARVMAILAAANLEGEFDA
jgi:hypothetical protein